MIEKQIFELIFKLRNIIFFIIHFSGKNFEHRCRILALILNKVSMFFGFICECFC